MAQMRPQRQQVRYIPPFDFHDRRSQCKRELPSTAVISASEAPRFRLASHHNAVALLPHAERAWMSARDVGEAAAPLQRPPRVGVGLRWTWPATRRLDRTAYPHASRAHSCPHHPARIHLAARSSRMQRSSKSSTGPRSCWLCPAGHEIPTPRRPCRARRASPSGGGERDQRPP